MPTARFTIGKRRTTKKQKGTTTTATATTAATTTTTATATTNTATLLPLLLLPLLLLPLLLLPLLLLLLLTLLLPLLLLLLLLPLLPLLLQLLVTDTSSLYSAAFLERVPIMSLHPDACHDKRSSRSSAKPDQSGSPSICDEMPIVSLSNTDNKIRTLSILQDNLWKRPSNKCEPVGPLTVIKKEHAFTSPFLTCLSAYFVATLRNYLMYPPVRILRIFYSAGAWCPFQDADLDLRTMIMRC